MAKLTNTSVLAAPAKAGRYDLWDDKLPGFAVRIFPSGTRSYFVQYRNAQGDAKRLTIGPHGEVWGVDKARARAAVLLREAATGGDPAAEKQRRRKDARVREVVDAYKLERVPLMKPSTRTSELWLLEADNGRSVVALFGKRPVASLDRADIERIKLDLRATPGAANKLIGIVSRLCAFAEAKGWRPPGSNPARGVKKNPERKIERWLTADERARLELALANAESAPERTPGHVDPVACACFRLLAMTGMRLGEALDLRWSDVDLDHGRLVLPTSKTQRGAIVRLSTSAVALLERVPRSDLLVFPGGSGQRATNMQRRWIVIRKAAGLDDVRIHDLRHAWASDAAMAGVPLHVIGKQLRHASPATTHRYAHLANDVVGAAVERVGEIIDGNTRRGDATPKVVALPKRKARAK